MLVSLRSAEKAQGKSWVPPRQHPETVFVPTDEAERMEALVEEVRPSKPKTTVNNKNPSAKPASTSGDISNNEADYEPGLRVITCPYCCS